MPSISALSSALLLVGAYGILPVASMVTVRAKPMRNHVESWEEDDDCNVRAWVRAEDLIPSAFLNGQ